jgi:hypothetical protein
MIVMLDTSHPLDKCEAEIGYPVEQLLTPLTRFKPQKPEDRFCIDNGAFSRFNAKGFLSLLDREYDRRELCRFVAVPDVVGSARRTLETFEHWSDMKELNHWPLAFVCQDGQENLPIPFHQIEAIFIGGSTEWKGSKAAIQCIKAAQVLGKWVHVGRVNAATPFEMFEQLGVDSVDGSGIARYSHMREKIRDRNGNHRLFDTADLLNA